MKKILFGCAIAICGLLPSVASADYGYGNNCCPTQCNPCCDQGSFEGFYVGGNIGVFSHIASRNDYDGFLTDTAGWSTNDTNFLAGAQLGYDWVCNAALYGLVVDWNWVDTDHRSPGGLGAVDSEFNWFTTIRARGGLTVCDALVYLTGGAAVVRSKVKWDNGISSFSTSDTRWGWVGGVGAEWLVWCNWSIGAEFLCLHFNNKNSSHGERGQTYKLGHSDSAWLGRVILNYRFGDLCSCW